MSRKLRFFKEQISKAGLIASARPVMQPDLELEELEVISVFLLSFSDNFLFYFSFIGFPLVSYSLDG